MSFGSYVFWGCVLRVVYGVIFLCLLEFSGVVSFWSCFGVLCIEVVWCFGICLLELCVLEFLLDLCLLELCVLLCGVFGVVSFGVCRSCFFLCVLELCGVFWELCLLELCRWWELCVGLEL